MISTLSFTLQLSLSLTFFFSQLEEEEEEEEEDRNWRKEQIDWIKRWRVRAAV